MEFKPRPYQDIIVDKILNEDRCAIFAECGLGKTSSCLQVIDLLSITDHYKFLVVAPLRVARDVWPKEIAKWDGFKHLTISPIIGNVKQRKEAILKKADIHTINYENLTWLLKTVGKKFPWNFVIADESTKLKSFRLRGGSKNARSLGRYAFTKIERMILLTGTPASNSLLDLWGQLWFVDKGERLGRTFTGFRDTFFELEHPNSFKYNMKAFGQEVIMKKIEDVCLSIRSKDWFDLRKPIYTKVPVYLSEKAMKNYTKLEKEMFLRLQDTEIEAFNQASVTMKCLQFANGFVYDEEKNAISIHKEKLQALDSIVNEWNGENIIVAYHFKKDLEMLKKHFPQGRVLDQNPQTLEDWNKGKIPLLFVHPQSAGHGLNLQDGGRIIVFFGHWWALENRLQAIERIGPTRQLQSGYDRNVYIYDLCAVNTIDELVLKRHGSKASVQAILMMYMKRKG
jgi:SNF2 family DNA or RNA helicase